MRELKSFMKEKCDDYPFYNYLVQKLFNADRKKYAYYRAGMRDSFSEDELCNMKILSILDELGFPMDDAGTYLYKSVISKAVKYLDGFDGFNRPISQDELLQQMTSPFSQFYLEVARYDLDIGIKTFHGLVENALDSVNFDVTDAMLLFEIYDDILPETNYGEHAFIMAKYVSRMMQKESDKSYSKAFIPVSASANAGNE